MADNRARATLHCLCWTLTRKDDTRIGFTDHDRDLTVNGLIHHASSGFTPADIDAKSGFSVDNSSASGLLTHDAITAADIDAGRYDGAKIEITRVNWADISEQTPVWTGFFGAIERKGDSFTVELSGHAAQLSRSQGRVFSRLCDARFGDARCGLNAADYPAGTQCPRTFSVCRDRFANTLNYRGFPYLIGDDAMQSGPGGSPALDGGSRYGDVF